LGWDTLPSQLSDISAAMQEARTEGPSAMARLALLCLCYRHSKSHSEISHQAEGRFLYDLNVLWQHLAAWAPRDSQYLPGTMIPLQPQIQRESGEEGRDEEGLRELPPAVFASIARLKDSCNARAREQRRWLQRFLDQDDYDLAWQVLDPIQETLLDDGWDFYDIMGHHDFHKFRYRWLKVVETLQPHTDANANPI
jgi:hypothetical protein